MEKETTQPEQTTHDKIKKATPQSAKGLFEAISNKISAAITAANSSTNNADALNTLKEAKAFYDANFKTASDARADSKKGTTSAFRGKDEAHLSAKQAKNDLETLHKQLERLISKKKSTVDASPQALELPIEDATQVAEQKSLAAEAEQQRLAAEAEQQKLAAEAEQQKLAAEAEQQKLAAEAEQQKLAAEALAKEKLAKEEQQKLAATPQAKYNTALAALKALVPSPQLKKPLDQLLAHIEALQQKRLEKAEGIDETLTLALTETTKLLETKTPTKGDIDAYKALANDLKGKPSIGLFVLGGFMFALAIVAAMLASTGISLIVVASAAAVSGATGIGGIASFWGGSRKGASKDLVDVANIEAKRVAPSAGA